MDILGTDNQLPYFFFYSFIILFVGMGLMPVLPLYAARFGASSSITRLYLSVIYVSITISTVLSSWLGSKLGCKRLYVLSAGLGAPALALMGQVSALWQVIILTALVWFSGGICMTLINVHTWRLFYGTVRTT
jgi:MFS family permease